MLDMTEKSEKYEHGDKNANILHKNTNVLYKKADTLLV